jgi:phosphotransferase system enzyme I (PtsP)
MDAVDLKDDINVDGTSGQLSSPRPPLLSREYERLEKDSQVAEKGWRACTTCPRVTTDGHKLSSGHIGLLSDIRVAKLNGAEGVGLYRTEFPYMTRNAFPTREEQTDILP